MRFVGIITLIWILAVGWTAMVAGAQTEGESDDDTGAEDVAAIVADSTPTAAPVLAPAPRATTAPINCPSDLLTQRANQLRARGFIPGSTVALILGGGTQQIRLDATADSQCIAVFDLQSLVPGNYDVRVIGRDPQGTTEITASITISPPPTSRAVAAPASAPPTSRSQTPRVSDFELRATHITVFSDRSYEIVGVIVNNGSVPAIARLAVQSCSDAISRAVDLSVDGSAFGDNIPSGGSVLFNITGGPLSYDCHWGRQTVSDPQGIRGDQVELTIRSVFTR